MEIDDPQLRQMGIDLRASLAKQLSATFLLLFKRNFKLQRIVHTTGTFVFCFQMLYLVPKLFN